MHPFDDLLCHAWSDIDGELLDERRGRERERRRRKAVAPLYLLCQHMHSTLLSFSHTTKSTLDLKNNNPRV
jgi:hypothetical protein